MSITRRSFLGALAGASVGGGLSLVGRAHAMGDRARLEIAQLSYDGGEWNPRPTALRRLTWEIEKRTSIEVKLEPVTMRATDPKLYQHPLLYIAGDREFPAWPESDVQALRRYLTLGGFVLVDNAKYDENAGFDASIRRELSRLFPRMPLSHLGDSHVIYKSFFLLSRPVGRTSEVGYLDVLEQDRRVMLAYAMNDLGGAWARDDYGRYLFEVVPGGESQREHAFRLGINLAMYALCLDYKDDQVHIPFILRRRKWRVE